MTFKLTCLRFSLFLLLCQSVNALANPANLHLQDTLSWRFCESLNAERVKCASIEVPADYQASPSQDNQSIRLDLVRASSESGLTKYPPLLFLAGGPGQSAIEVFPYVLNIYSKLRKHRDIYTVAMRGTKGGGELICQAEADSLNAGELFVNKDRQLALIKSCVSERNYNPLHYSTEYFIRDLETVRKALGLEKWDLHGVSYGTRAAIEYARLFPQSVQKIVLEGVAGFGHPIGDEIHKIGSQQLERIANECLAQEDCRDAFGDSMEMVNRLLQKTKDQPQSLTMDVYGKKRRYDFHQEDVVGALYSHLYQPETWITLPVRVHRALLLDDYSGLFSLLNTHENINTSVYWSVVCQEDVPYYKALNSSPDLVFPDHRDRFVAICDAWLGEETTTRIEEQLQSGKVSSVHKPFQSEHSILLLSGEYDPVTIPAYGDSILANFPNAKQVIFKGQGHNIGHLPCGRKIMKSFLEEEKDWQDESCGQKLFRWPYFSSGAGFELGKTKVEKTK